MALWFVLNVNDMAIGALTMQRIEGGTDPDNINTYKVELNYSPVPGDWERFEVQHRYGDGAWVLVHKALGKLLEGGE